MSSETLFINALINTFPDDVPDPFFARWFNSFSKQVRYNVVQRKVASITLDAGQAKVITPATGAESDWGFVLARVIGAARLETVGVDTDNTTPISGYTAAYGTAVLPGYVILSTYNVDTFTLHGEQDGTVIELFTAISQED